MCVCVYMCVCVCVCVHAFKHASWVRNVKSVGVVLFFKMEGSFQV